MYGELTSMLPHVGGFFVFIHNAFGKEAAFWGAWSFMLAYSAVIAFQLYAIGGLISYLWWPEMPHSALMVTMYFGFELIPQFAEESKYPVKSCGYHSSGLSYFVLSFMHDCAASTPECCRLISYQKWK